MSTLMYRPAHRNSTALNVVASWLETTKIPFDLGSSGSDLDIKAQDGSTVNVLILSRYEHRPKGFRGVVARAHRLTDTDPQEVLPEFWQITKAAGYGKPTPPYRPLRLKKRLCGDDFFLASVRYRETLGAPNPTKEQVEMVTPIMRNRCFSFLKRNAKACRKMGYTFEDLWSYANIWAAVFWHRYQVRSPTHVEGHDNLRLFNVMLEQRFLHLAQKMNRHVAVYEPERLSNKTPEELQVASESDEYRLNPLGRLVFELGEETAKAKLVAAEGNTQLAADVRDAARSLLDQMLAKSK